MLVLADRGGYSFAMLEALLKRGAQAMICVPANVKPRLVERLWDGTMLTRVTPAGHHPQEGRGQAGTPDYLQL